MRDALATLRTRNVTVNLHHDGVAPSSFAAGTTLGGAFRVLSTNVDAKGKAFASTIEATGGVDAAATGKRVADSTAVAADCRNLLGELIAVNTMNESTVEPPV